MGVLYTAVGTHYAKTIADTALECACFGTRASFELVDLSELEDSVVENLEDCTMIYFLHSESAAGFAFAHFDIPGQHVLEGYLESEEQSYTG